MHATNTLAEADRLMTLCNSCRYCEGLCAVFPAMEMRREFLDGDLNYLANLCHSCGACYADCQFSPPHEFNVNVPKVMAQARTDSYEAYAWPQALAPMFRQNGLKISIVAAVSVAVFIAGFVAWRDPAVLFGTHAGNFYRLMPHNTMVAIFGGAFLYAIFAMAMGVRAFWKDIGEPAKTFTEGPSLWQAIKDASSLRYLDGGGVGCMNESERPTDNRRIYHHFTFYGFMLCFASTSVATIYHYGFGWQAPYPVFSLPVILGTIGGIGLLIGPVGLLIAKSHRDPAMMDTSRTGMDVAFLVMLFLTSLTGLALLILRDTAAMGMLLAIHLGVVFALFVTMPYGKFVHGIYRFLALVRYAKEKRMLEEGEAGTA
jgi:citrate/tricarballylate utilization protein